MVNLALWILMEKISDKIPALLFCGTMHSFFLLPAITLHCQRTKYGTFYEILRPFKMNKHNCIRIKWNVSLQMGANDITSEHQNISSSDDDNIITHTCAHIISYGRFDLTKTKKIKIKWKQNYNRQNWRVQMHKTENYLIMLMLHDADIRLCYCFYFHLPFSRASILRDTCHHNVWNLLLLLWAITAK